MRASSASTSISTLPAGQGPDDVGGQAAGEHGDAVVAAGHLDLDGDRQLEVGAGEAQRVPGELDADAGEHGQRGAASGRGAPGAAERLDEDITLTSELHAVARFLPSCCACNEGVVVGAVDWG